MQVESIAKALGDESRRKIVELLKDGELPASTIFEQFNYAAPTISRHLSVLKEAGVVSTRRNGVFIYYSLDKEALQVIQNWLAPLLGSPLEKPQSAPRDRSQKPKIKTASNPFEKFQSEF